MPDTIDLLGLAIDKNPIDFADTMNSILRDKALTALENKRIEIAQSIYGDPTDSDDLDDDFEDDLDDLDLDLGDLDLYDLDLDSFDSEDTDDNA